ncbi:MAG: hypothetical protein COY39_01485 [Alphaproteobacteria bacterium CG_4_10_14_0_8_um_filter_37_21]|nr:MAG: hypothetical protein COY39_01485 [Alphaproteobacteria bacterium CG_4_10_14_0_8_um_filter_37_21]
MTQEKHTIIQPKTNFFSLNIAELMQWKFLFFLMVRRNIKVLYQNTAIGISWIGIQSILTLLVFSALLMRMGGLETQEIPYPLFAFGGIILWQGFSKALLHGSGSLIAQQSVITKVYFPRILIPFSTVTSVGIDILVNFIFFIALFVVYSFQPSLTSILSILLLGLSLVVAFFASLIFCALSLRYRDLQLILPFIMQIGQFATPIFYPLSALSRKWQLVVAINPITSVVELLRWSLFEKYPFPDLFILSVSFFSFFCMCLMGVYLFNKNERQAAELL